MNFEILSALRDLDRQTPLFLKQEIFHHGSQEVRGEAVRALQALAPEQRSNRVLREMLKVA